MRVLIVFSSFMGTDVDDWGKITNFQKPVNVNKDGKLFVFNGKDKKYYDNKKWKFSELKKEINNIINCENGDNQYVVLLHTKKPEYLEKLKETCSELNVSTFKRFSTAGDLWKKYILPLIRVIRGEQNNFSKLWKKLQEKDAVEKTPVKMMKAEAREAANHICDHNCSNAITYLSIRINELKGSIDSKSKNAKKKILDFGKDYANNIYEDSIDQLVKIKKIFTNNPEINKIPRLLAGAKKKYAIMYEKAKCTDNDSNKVIVENGQTVIQLHQETIDILKKEVLQNGE
jgi:hypothetical protein